MPQHLELDSLETESVFVCEGVGHVRVEAGPGLTVDVFITHVIAGSCNYQYREKQVSSFRSILFCSLIFVD